MFLNEELQILGVLGFLTWRKMGEKQHRSDKIKSTKIPERQPSQNLTWALLEFTVQS